ncbi:MAG: hypothetical protein ACOYOQ_13220 [Microthrixaceae bacterium]
MVDRFHLVFALVCLAVGVSLVLVDRLGWRPWTARSVAVAGILVPCLSAGDTSRWTIWLAVAALVLPFPDRGVPAHPLGRWTLLLGVAGLAGVWAAVPDTEPVVAVAGVLAPLAVARFARGPSPGPAGSAAAVVVIGGAVWAGSAGRGAALASVVALGMLVVLPVVVGWGAGRVRPERNRWVVVAHVVVVLVVPRLLIGLDVAVAWSAAGAAVMGLALVARWSRSSGSGVATTAPGHVAG